MTNIGVPYCDSPPQRCKHAIDIIAPVSGSVLPITSISNGLVALGVIGAGALIKVSGSQMYSPMNATVYDITPTGNRIDLKTQNGLLLRVEFLPDISHFHGERIRFHVKKGQNVQAGTCLFDFDRQFLKTDSGDLNVTVTILNRISPRGINLHIPPSASQKRVVAAQDRLMTAYW